MIINIIFISCAFILGIYWLILISNSEFKNAFLLQIIMFPFTSKAQDYISITAYTTEAGYKQVISFTTFMIIILFVSVILNHRSSIKNIDRKILKFMNLFLVFATTILIAQIFNHSILSALLLSLGSMWQYFMIFYILLIIIKTPQDYFKLLNSIFIFSIINIVFRITLGTGGGQQIFQEVSKQSSPDELNRASTLALGPAVSYAGYLAVFITLGLGMYRVTGKKIYFLYVILIFFELLDTFTRGGLLMIPLLSLLVLWKSERKYLKRYLIFLIPIMLFLGSKLILYFTIRNDSYNLESDASVWLRLYVYLNYFSQHFNFSLIGNGIANQTQIWIPLVNIYLPLHNAFLEVLDQCGLPAFILFLLLMGQSLYNLLNIAKDKDKYSLVRLDLLLPYILISFVQWTIFANTTSTSILFYYPYEGTTIFYIILFSPFIIINISPNNVNSNSNLKLSYNY